MNGLIKDIANARIDSMIRLHSLLDKVLETCATDFAKDNSIELDRNTLNFHVDVPDCEGYNCVIETNVNTSCVRVYCIDARDNNEPVAQCEISIFGQFAETYSRITDIDLKLELAKWFAQISCIDVKELETTIEPDMNIPADEENTEDEESSTMTASDGTEVEVVDEDESIAD